MIKSYLAKASPISALILALHLLAATGFASTVPARHRHRRASAAHPGAQRPVRAPLKQPPPPACAAHPGAQRPVRAPLKQVVAVASRTPTRLRVVQAPKAALAGPRRVAPAPAIHAGGPWTSPTYADSTDGDNIDGEDMDIR